MAPERPQLDKPEGDIPFELGIDDITVGDGAEATAGTKVSVHYVGVAFSTGEEFDASWNRGQPFEFKLGKGQVIPGWDQGVAGDEGRRPPQADDPVRDGLRRAWSRERDRAARAARVRGRPALGRLSYARRGRGGLGRVGQADGTVGRGALVPAPEEERHREQLEERADGERGPVARRRRPPCRARAGSRRRRSSPSASRTRARSPAAATGSCRSGTPAGSACSRRREAPHDEQGQRQPEASRPAPSSARIAALVIAPRISEVVRFSNSARIRGAA